MSVDISDEDIYPAYERVLHGDEDWLLLKYAAGNKLYLCDLGVGNIEEIKSKLQNDIYFTFLRFTETHDGLPCYVLLSIVPEGTSGVRRARALVHGRAVASLFKAHQVLLHVTSLEQLSAIEIARRIAEDQQASSPSAASTQYTQSPPPSARLYQRPAPLNQEPSSIGSETRTTDDLPPPTPPKPYFRSSNSNMRPAVSQHNTSSRRTASETIGPKAKAGDTMDAAQYFSDPPIRSQSEFRPRSKSTNARRVGSDIPVDQDPEVQARMRAEIKRLREIAEREMLEADVEASRAPKHVTSHLISIDPYEEKARKYEEEKEKQRRIAMRLLKEQARREQEEREQRERAQKLKEERDRRLRNARMAQESREKEAREKSNMARREAQEQQLRKSALKANLANIHLQLTQGKDMRGVIQSGHISVQPPDSIVWKRRYYEITKIAATFYKDEKKTKALESMPIAGRLAGIKQWDDGFEEIRSIPHSFAVEFRDSEPPWLFYGDTEQQMEVLAGLLSGL